MLTKILSDDQDELLREERRLLSRLQTALAREIETSGVRIRESIAPYSRIIRAEGKKLRVIDQELRKIGAALLVRRARVERQAA